jgi:NADPH:quinone reductase-like Zn-dependent oxidoreductase
VPTPGKGEVLVRVVASAVNPSDVKNVAGAFHSPLARVPGRDYAGVVAMGDGWTGKEVWGSAPAWGGHLIEATTSPTLEVYATSYTEPLYKRLDPATDLLLIDPSLER